MQTSPSVCFVFVFAKTYGIVAVDLDNISLLVNNSDLVKDDDVDLKSNCDPTEKLVSLNINANITFKQIFNEVATFIHSNSHKQKQCLEYAKIWLKCNTPKCNENTKCEQCCTDKNKNKDSSIKIFDLCVNKRREIAQKLSATAHERCCVTDSLCKTASKLSINDRLLVKDSYEYKLNKNWFVNLYSFLKWYQEVIQILLYNLVYLNEKSISAIDEQESHKMRADDLHIDVSDDDAKDIEYTTNEEESVFLFKFDVLTIVNSFVDQIIAYLVLYYCCFDASSWIGVFYPFIESSIGSRYCKMLFCQTQKQESRDVSALVISLCNHVLETQKNISMKEVVKTRERCLQEMRAISKFKQLLFDSIAAKHNSEINLVYNDRLSTKNTFNCFRFTNLICIKLQETVNNIKTQLLINEMAIKENKNNLVDTNDAKSQLQIQEKLKTDDWIINVDDDNIINIEQPSFIRLFVFRRIIDKYIKHSNNKDETSARATVIKQFADVFKDNEKIESLVVNILTRLLNYGIKKYMKNCYSEKEQANIIEQIFNRIILTKFGQEYNEIINHASNYDNDSFYQSMVFNSSDLMCEIFQYLEYGAKFDQDLFQCSLVNSYWLYHAWNINAVYHVDLGELFGKTSFMYRGNKKINKWTQLWQRLIHVKSIRLSVKVVDDTRKDNGTRTPALDKLSMLRKIEKVHIYAYGNVGGNKYIPIFKALLGRCKQRLEYCHTSISSYSKLKEHELPPLRLPNTQFIGIGDLKFYRVWTNKCTWLKLYDTKIKQDWCDFVMKNCDCSSITLLELNDVQFDSQLINNSVLRQFATKFINLKQLKLYFHDRIGANVFIFWQLLKSTIKQKNVETELTLHTIRSNEINELNEIIDKRDLTVDKLTLGSIPKNGLVGIEKLIQERDGCGLKHLVIRYKMIYLLKQLSFKSIVVFEVYDSSGYCDYDNVNHVLGSSLIVEKRISVIIKIKMNYIACSKNSHSFLSLFKQLCENICQLIFHQIAIEIDIKFINVHHNAICNSHLSVYSTYFRSKEFHQKYKQPRCNSHSFVPRGNLYTYFYINESDNSFALRVTNIKYL